MAETYRGLTIRIGANTTKLSAALKTAESAISATQSQLNKLKQALRLDPGNISNIQSQISGVGEKAEDYYLKLTRLRDAYDKLSNTKLTNGDGTVGELAKQTENVQLKAKLLHERFNSVNEELAKTYNQLEKASGVKLDDDNIGSEESVKRFKELGIKAEDITRDSVDMAKKLQEVLGKDVISDEMISHLSTLKKNFVDIQKSMKDMDRAAKLENMGTDLKLVEANATASARAMSKLKQASELSNTSKVKVLDDELQKVSSASEETQGRLRKVNEALKLDPSNVMATEQKTALLKQSIEQAATKAQLLDDKLKAYEDAGVDKLANGFDDVSQAVVETRDKFESTSDALNEAKGNLDQLESKLNSYKDIDVGKQTDEFERTKSAVDNARNEVSRLSDAANQAEEAYDGALAAQEFEKTKDAASDARSEVQNLSEQLSNIGKDGLEDGIGRASTQIYDFGKGVSNVGYALDSTIGQGLRNVGTKALDSAKTVDSSFRDMAKTVNGTKSQFNSLRSSAETFSLTHVTSADQILEIEAMGGQLGISADKLSQFANTASNIDIATDIDANTAAQQLGQLNGIMDDLQVTADKTHGGMSNFADALVRLGNNSPTLESNIMDITTRIASQSNILGMTTPQVLGWSTAIAATGQKSEAAGTAMAKTMSQIESAVGQGGDALKGFAEVAGMSADDFKAKWEKDPSAALESFIKGLKRINDEGGSVDNTLAKLGISSVRQKQGLEGLTKTVGSLDNYLKMSGDAWSGVSDQWGKAGDAAREADKKSRGLSGTMAKLSNAEQVFGSAVGEGMVPYLNAGADALKGLTKSFSGLNDSAKSGVVAIGGIAAVMPKLLISGGQVIMGVNSIKDTLGGLSSGSGILSVLTNKWVLLGVAGVAAAIAIKAGIDNYTQSMERSRKVSEGVEDALDDLYDGNEKLGDSAEDAAKRTQDAFDKMVESSDKARKAHQKYVDVSEKAADSSQKAVDKYENENASLEHAGSVIDTYINKSGLSETQQRELCDAIDTVNSACGTQYKVVDASAGKIQDETGKIQDNTKEIWNNIHAREQQAKADTIGTIKSGVDQKYSASANEYGEDVQALKDSQDAFAAAQKSANRYHVTLSNAQGIIDNYYNHTGNVSKAQKDVASKLLGASRAIKMNAQETRKAEKTTRALAQKSANLATAQDAVSLKASGAKMSMAQLVEASDVAQQAFTNNSKQSKLSLSQFSETLSSVAKDQGKLQQVMSDPQAFAQIVNAYDGTASSIEGVLNQLGIHYDSVKGKQIDAANAAKQFESVWDGMSDEAYANLAGMGMTFDSFSQKMKDAGINAQWLGTVGKQNFSQLAATAPNIDVLTTRLQNLQKLNLDPKHFTVTDEGTIQLENGLVIDLDKKTINDKPYHVNDDGTISVEGTNIDHFDKKKLQDKDFKIVDKTGSAKKAKNDVDSVGKSADNVSKKKATINVSAKTASAKNRLEVINALADKTNSKKPKVKVSESGSKGAETKIKKVSSAADNLNRKKATTKISATDNASSKISSVAQKLSKLDGKSATVTITTVTKEKKGGNARGGIIQRHAAGAVYTRATMIDSYNEIGEAGAEYFDGTHIVPLTNSKYSTPFARVIAEEFMSMLKGELSKQTSGAVAGGEMLVDWLDRNLGPTIRENAPSMTIREARRLL